MKKYIKYKKYIFTAIIDVVAYGLIMGGILLYFYIIPQGLEGKNTVVGDSGTLGSFSLPNTSSDNEENAANVNDDDNSETHKSVSEQTDSDDDNNTQTGNDGSGNTDGVQAGSKLPDGEADNTKTDTETSTYADKVYNDHTFSQGTNYDNIGTQIYSSSEKEAEDILSAVTDTEEIGSYSNASVNITVSKKNIKEKDITYYVADIYISDLSLFKAALAYDTYGSNIRESSLSISSRNNAILSITGDSYGNNSSGLVVRNGILYRDNGNDADLCLIYTDGTMETFTADEFKYGASMNRGVWQAFSFGPMLLDENGHILPSFNSSSYLNERHPRVALGYVAPGHYVFIVVDGRKPGYSVGATYSELAAMMIMENCVTAYNLDGGGSSSMYFNGSYVNNASDRKISDIIYIPAN